MEQKKTSKKPIFVFLIIVAVMIILAILFKSINIDVKNDSSDSDASKVNSDFIAELDINGMITSSSAGMFNEQAYNHQFLLDTIDELRDNTNNKGILLFINSPGGGVYESDELYLKIKDYQEKTHRPVYAQFGSLAASGGYYISASADKIAINRNGITGSIGVRLNTIYDFSGLLEKYDIKHANIVAGKNKAMGSNVDPLTKEQKKIYQSIVDEAYDQFIDIVSDGRDMSKAKAKKIGDGRIYTAKQALNNGLVDDIATKDETIAKMKKDNQLHDCEVKSFSPDAESFIDKIFSSVKMLSESRTTEVENILRLQEGNTFSVNYLFQS